MEEKRPRSNTPPPSENDSADEGDSTHKKPSEKSLYKNIPLQGTHRGEVDDSLTSSVRAQEPVDPTAPAERVEEEPSGEQASDANE